MSNNNKPVPLNSPAGMVQSLLGMIPAGASVTVTVPVAVDRNLQVSVGIAQNMRPQPEQPKVIDVSPEFPSVPARYWYQQPEAE